MPARGAADLMRASLLLLTGSALILGSGSVWAASKAGDRWGADYFPNVSLVSHEANPPSRAANRTRFSSTTPADRRPDR